MKDLKKACRYFYKYLSPYWKAIAVMVILTLAATFFQVIAPVYMGNAVTELGKYLAQYMDPKTRATASMASFYQALFLSAFPAECAL